MARPITDKADYFPHYAEGGRTMYILDEQHGNDGYAFWFKLLEILTATEGHVYDCRKPGALEFLQARTHLTAEKAETILNLLAKLDAIDADLWSRRVIWVQNLVNNFKDLYKNRRRPLPSKPGFHPENPGTAPVSTPENHSAAPVSTPRNHQSKVKDIKVKERSKPLSSGKASFPEGSDEWSCAFLLFNLIRQRRPTFKEPNLQSWAKQIDLMIRKDNRPVEEIRQVITWCQGDDFWQNNILSTAKLKAQFDQLALKMGRAKPTIKPPAQADPGSWDRFATKPEEAKA
jgi:hypothetical protein